MACLDNLQIVQTITYSVAPNVPQGYVLGQISIDILNTNLLPISGTLTIDRTRDLPVIDLEDSPIAQVENITSTGETFNSYFYYPVSQPISITINATVDVRIGDCLYRAECNHVLLTPNEGEEESSCTVDVQGYAVVSGCTNPLYYEYNANANVDDGSCTTLIPILGCTNPLAYNYNPLATKNDGTCIFTSGCTNPIANNYDESAVIDDGSCECADISIQLNIVEASGQSIIIEPNCDYVIEFDLFTRINCASFLSYFERSDQTVLEILNSLKINTQIYTLLDSDSNTIDYSGGTIDLSGTSYALIQNENIYSFDISKSPVGIGVDDGNNEFCTTFFDLIATEQGLECQSFDKTKFDVNWQHYSFALNSDLVNTFTKFVLNYQNFSFGICTYIDNLKVSKVCTTPYEKCVLIPSRYGFDLERVVDNKKSWTITDTTTSRTYNYEHRETDYLDYDSRLIFNTKELELQINPVKYIQSDVVAFFNEYEKFYTDDSKTQTLSLDKIENEYIDVKNRQTIRSYSYLPNLYQKYLLGLDCASSKGLHYDYVFDILQRTGTLWHQMVKQLIPATAIWQGNEYILKNTVFDSQKFSYRRYSLDDGTGASDGNCAPSGVTIECQTISDKCFDSPFESIDDLLVSGMSDIICEQSGNTVCFSEFIGDGSFSGRLIQYFDLSGDNIDVLNLYGYQNYNCFSGTPLEIIGCTNPLAINYNPLATIDDGSCIICPLIVYGCTYPSALNYDSNANFDDGSCVFNTGATLVVCGYDISDFDCKLEYVYTSDFPSFEHTHEFLMKLISPLSTYTGSIIGSWKINGINHREPLQTDPDFKKYVKSSDLTVEVFGDLEDYIEMGFNNLTDITYTISTLPPSIVSDSAWYVNIIENLIISPTFTTGKLIEISISFVTVDGCLFTGATTITLGTSANPTITLTKIFP
jgi:hypothetical protein